MPNAKDAGDTAKDRILLIGSTGSGKTAQIWTLPGRKFAYIFDPNSMKTLQGCDLDYEEFYPEILELDATLKGFNKGTKDDKPATKREPTLYMRWVDDLNAKVEGGVLRDYDWLIIDSLTFLNKAVMDRQLFINGRYGDIEDLGDYRVVGSKLADLFGSIAGLREINVLCTGHFQVFEDDKTKRIKTQISLPGKARNVLPLLFTNIWLCHTEESDDKKKPGLRYMVRTQPDPRGLTDIRNSIQGLELNEDVTIPSLTNAAAGTQGIGRLLSTKK